MGMREKLIELLDETFEKQYDKNLVITAYSTANHLIANGVTIPVRCKECKHWSDGVRGCTDNVKCCKIGYYMVGENGYCVFGERKTNE